MDEISINDIKEIARDFIKNYKIGSKFKITSTNVTEYTCDILFDMFGDMVLCLRSIP